MAIEEDIELCHYETGERIVVKAKKTSKEGEYIAHCINPNHPDKHPSMGINIIKGVYNCISRQDAKGVTWAKHLEGQGDSKASKKALQKRRDSETKSEILMALNTDLLNWEGYDSQIKEEARARLSFDLCFLPEDERAVSIGALTEAGIFRRSELLSRLKITGNFLEKIKRKEKEEKKKKKIKTVTNIPGLVHLVKDGETVKYLVLNEGKLKIEENFLDVEEIVCRPKQDLPYYHCKPDILEMSQDVNFAKLLKDIESYIFDYLELPEKKDYFLLALWVFHTYIMEKFNTTPYLYFTGVYASGKTRAGEILLELSFRGWPMTSPTEASLFRPIQYYEPTIHLDHCRFFGAEVNQAVRLLLQSGYKRGLTVVRNDLQVPGEEGTNLFPVFGAKIISSEDSLTGALKSRSITFMMKENISKRVERAFDLEKSKNIRDRLIMFRVNYMNQDLAEPFETTARRRLAEILEPLNQIIITIAPDRKEEFETIIKEIQGEVRDEEQFSLEAEIVDNLVHYYNEDLEPTILSSELTRLVNEGRPENEKYKTNYISRLTRNLTFKRRPLAKYKARSAFIINFDLLEELSKKYNTTRLNKKAREYQGKLDFSTSKK